MNIYNEIRKLMIDENQTVTALAKKLNTSQQNLDAKLKRNNLKISDLENILDALGYDLKIEFIKRK